MKKLDFPFFRFYDESEDVSYVLPLTWDKHKIPNLYNFPEMVDFMDWRVQPLMEDHNLETEFGIHDFDTHGENMILGFASYEVEKEKVPELMEHWRRILEAADLEVGELAIIKGSVVG